MKKIARMTLLGLFLALAAAAVFFFPALAQDPQPTPSDDEVNRVAKQMFCPVCENIPLDVCPTKACTDWRELIRLRLSEGWTDEQIKEYFAQQYGDRVLAEPPRRGLNWLVYILPIVALLVGTAILVKVLASMQKRRGLAAGAGGSSGMPGPAEPAAQPDDPYLSRLEEELRKKE